VTAAIVAAAAAEVAAAAAAVASSTVAELLPAISNSSWHMPAAKGRLCAQAGHGQGQGFGLERRGVY
jgi:hypothetical protein